MWCAYALATKEARYPACASSGSFEPRESSFHVSMVEESVKREGKGGPPELPTAFHGSGCQIFFRFFFFCVLVCFLPFFSLSLFLYFFIFFIFLKVYSEDCVRSRWIIAGLCEEGGPSFHTLFGCAGFMYLACVERPTVCPAYVMWSVSLISVVCIIDDCIKSRGALDDQAYRDRWIAHARPGI